jgi:hypothetical protein
MIASLKTMRAEGVSLLLCAEQLGVSYDTAVRKARELGIANSMSRGRTPGTAMVQRSKRESR